MVVNVTKLSQNMKNKSLSSIEKYYRTEKWLIIIIRKYFNLEHYPSL